MATIDLYAAVARFAAAQTWTAKQTFGPYADVNAGPDARTHAGRHVDPDPDSEARTNPNAGTQAQGLELPTPENAQALDALDTLQMVLSHEMGHFYGLMAHSRRCVDVLSYYHDGKGGQCFTRNPGLLKAFPEYRSSLPTACDIQRCRILNRIP